MRIVGYQYVPNRFTVTQGVPVQWWIDASEAAGCGRILIAPKLGVRRLLSSNSTTVISFVPQETGDYGFNCAMGMMRSEEHTSELQSHLNLVCRLLLEKKKQKIQHTSKTTRRHRVEA